MKRLRSRLIVAFLSVTILAMISMALVQYYTLYVRYRITRTQMLLSVNERVEQYVRGIQDQLLQNILLPAAREVEKKLVDSPFLVDLLETGNDPDYLALQENLILSKYVKKPFNQYLRVGEDLRLLSKAGYLEMEPWLQERNLYEKDGKIYLWYCKELRKGQSKSEMETVGGLFIRRLLLEKNPNDDRFLILYIPQLTDQMPTIIAPRPGLLEDYLTPNEMGRLFDFDQDGLFQTVDIPKVNIPWLAYGRPVQARFIPLVNQRKELTAVMIFAMPIAEVWNTIGPSMLISLTAILLVIVAAAVWMARSIARPINELASAAERMSRGDFNVRAPIAGVQEQKVLSAAFNQLADTIVRQLDQLHRQTREMELRNLELAQTHRFLENILSNIHTGVLSTDEEGRISLINRAGLGILRLDEAVGRKVDEVEGLSPLRNLIHYSLQSGSSVFQEEVPCATREGETVPLEVGAVPLLQEGRLVGLVVTFHDLSAIRKLEEQVRRQDRLAALGRMAAGVAHEIRNPLSIIHGSAQLLQKRFGGQPGEEGLSDFIIEEVNRLSRVVTDFLMFARPPVPALEEISIEELLDQICAYTQNELISDRYALVKEVEENLPAVAADPRLCRQAFLNLFLNAREAMPEGGTITVRSRRWSSHEVAIEVADEGEGIRPEALDRIFDPFFTTKENGTGLGLSLVHQIIASQGGRIEVDSACARGAVFRLIFPSYDSIRPSTPSRVIG